MLFSAFVLISIYGKHHGLKQGIDFGHGNEATKMRNISWLSLKQEEKVAVLLCLLIAWKVTLGQVCRGVKMTGDFILLNNPIS